MTEHIILIFLYLGGLILISGICFLFLTLLHRRAMKAITELEDLKIAHIEKEPEEAKPITALFPNNIEDDVIPQIAIDFIKKEEGFRATIYKDEGGKMTIGYGETNFPPDMTILSEEDAEKLLELDLKELKKEILSLLMVKINDNQLASLLSFTYNLGLQHFKDSTLLRYINNNESPRHIQDAFLMWKFVAGKLSTGLYKRRVLEAALYLKADTQI